MRQNVVQVERRGDRQSEKQRFKPKQKRWSHQDELQALKGKKITLVMDAGANVVELLDSDQFTLKIRNNQQSILTVFKHAIQAYGLAE